MWLNCDGENMESVPVKSVFLDSDSINRLLFVYHIGFNQLNMYFVWYITAHKSRILKWGRPLDMSHFPKCALLVKCSCSFCYVFIQGNKAQGNNMSEDKEDANKTLWWGSGDER